MAYLFRENPADHIKSACTEKNARRTLKQQAVLNTLRLYINLLEIEMGKEKQIAWSYRLCEAFIQFLWF